MSERQIHNLIKSGTLKAKRMGWPWMISEQALKARRVVERSVGRPKRRKQSVARSIPA